jgi:predicted lipoprotein with Yx(FWY)xxD motif
VRLIRGLAALVVACVLAGAALASSSSQAVVKMRSTSLGNILVAGNGKTLYMFARDKSAKSSCFGACAAFWPPLLTTGAPKAGAGITAALLGTTHRSDGKVQVTYHSHPLYFFAKDTKAGQTNGEGVAAFGAKWFALSPAGTKVTPPSAAGGGYG